MNNVIVGCLQDTEKSDVGSHPLQNPEALIDGGVCRRAARDCTNYCCIFVLFLRHHMRPVQIMVMYTSPVPIQTIRFFAPLILGPGLSRECAKERIDKTASFLLKEGVGGNDNRPQTSSPAPQPPVSSPPSLSFRSLNMK